MQQRRKVSKLFDTLRRSCVDSIVILLLSLRLRCVCFTSVNQERSNQSPGVLSNARGVSSAHGGSKGRTSSFAAQHSKRFVDNILWAASPLLFRERGPKKLSP